jgi:uncharacterized protein YqgV (UPF0045/DUF77 family)
MSETDITGCRFSLYPMSNDYVDIILGSVGKVDTSKVWSSTDHMGTVYRGRQSHVLDCARAVFVHAWREDVHITGEFTFSKGCPADTDADRFLANDDVMCNSTAKGDFSAAACIAFYAFGVGNYIDHIRYVIELAEKRGLKPKTAHYGTMLEGSAAALFAYFDELLGYAYKHIPHYTLEAALSVNSPTQQKLKE